MTLYQLTCSSGLILQADIREWLNREFRQTIDRHLTLREGVDSVIGFLPGLAGFLLIEGSAG